VQAGGRILIGKGVYHGFATAASSLRFLSVQSPPILDEATGQLDLEPRGRAGSADPGWAVRPVLV
jgi:hypothetical protein